MLEQETRFVTADPFSLEAQYARQSSPPSLRASKRGPNAAVKEKDGIESSSFWEELSSEGDAIKSNYERWFRNNKEQWNFPEGFTIHGLRHSATTLLQRDLGVDAKTTMCITGHKTMQMLDNYSHTDMAAKREAMRRMDALIAPTDDARCCGNCRRWTRDPEDASHGVCWISGSDSLVVLSGR